MFLEEILGVNPSWTKNYLAAVLLDKSRAYGGELSISNAKSWADKIKRGKYNRETVLDLARVIGYSDPTGERATNNVMRELALA